jgi:class 3 adenylate cyclase
MANEANSSPASIAGTAATDVVQSQRVLLTFLLTDIVGSTQTAERLGDHAWCSLLFRHHSIVRGHLKSYNGREIDAVGDGFFLTFDRPGLAVHFAIAVRAALKDIGIDIRAGIHAGECELIDGRVQGIAVHTTARIAHAADDGEILVSNTVRDLLAGSGLRFSGRDEQILKGLSEPRRLFALQL